MKVQPIRVNVQADKSKAHLKKVNSYARRNEDYSSLNYSTVVAFYGQNIKKVSFKSEQGVQNNFSYIKFLSEAQGSGQVVKAFLNNILNNDKTRNAFIEEVTISPQKSQAIVKFLQNKLGGTNNFLTWYLGENGYVVNYEKYLQDKYKQANSIDELLKIQPNWGYWALERKQLELDGLKNHEETYMRDQRINFNFGTLPDGITDKDNFDELITRLKNLPFGFKNKDLNIYEDSFKVSQLSGGDKSAKNIYKIVCNDNPEKKFIIKMDRFHPEDKLEHYNNPYVSRFAKESKLLRGDSVYLDACLDYYLQLNGSKSNAKLLYYDFKKNAAIYEYIDGIEINETSKTDLLDAMQANRLLSDINELGVYLNDISLSYNCYKDKNGGYRVIDIGHAEFIDLLKPGAKLLTIETSNLCGFSLKNVIAGLNTPTINNFENKTIAPYLDNTAYNYNVDYSLFMDHRKEIKENIKKEISSNIDKYGETSEETLDSRYKLVEFYKSNLLARKAGYGSLNKHITNGILDAINREILLIEKNDVNGKYSEVCNFYKDFVEETSI